MTSQPGYNTHIAQDLRVKATRPEIWLVIEHNTKILFFKK